MNTNRFKPALNILLAGLAIPCFAGVIGKPVTISIGIVGGASYSTLKADSTIKKLFVPTSKTDPVIAPVLGLEFEIQAGKWLSVLTGMRYYKRGQNTRKTQVYFQDDLFLHDFSSQAEITYFAVPVSVKSGLDKMGFKIQGKIGIMPELVLSDSIFWNIDGLKSVPGSARVPSISESRWDAALVAGIEAGYAFRRHYLFIGCDWEHGLKSIASGIPGNAYNRTAVVTLGYRFRVW